MGEAERHGREAERKAEIAVAIAALALAASTHRPRKKTIGDRLWDLL